MIHPQAGAAIQRDPGRLEERAGRHFVKFSKDKGKALPQEGRAPEYVAHWGLALQVRDPWGQQAGHRPAGHLGSILVA